MPSPRLLLAAVLLAAATAHAAVLPEHRALRLLVVGDEVNPHGLPPAELTQPADLAVALADAANGLTLATDPEAVFLVGTDEIELATARLAVPFDDPLAFDAVIYFSHRIPEMGADPTGRQEAFVAAVESYVEAGGCFIAFHHGAFVTAGKESVQDLIGARAVVPVIWDDTSGQDVIAVAPEHFIAAHAIGYDGTRAYADPAVGVPAGIYPYFTNTPDERYPALTIDAGAGDVDVLFASDYDAGTHVLGFTHRRPGWEGAVVFYQPGEHEPTALDLDGRNFQVLANAIFWGAAPRLTVRKQAGEAVLEWEGGLPAFDVHASTDPRALSSASSHEATTSDRTFTDATSARVVYYRVWRSDGPPAPCPPDLQDLSVDASRIPCIDAAHARPVDTSGWTLVDYVGPQTGNDVKAALDALPPESVLVLPPGTYSGSLRVRRSDVVVRGDCSDPSAVTWSHSGLPPNSLFSGPLCDGGMNDGLACWNGDADCPGGTCDLSVQGTLCSQGWLQLCGGDDGDHLTRLLDPPQVWSGPHARGTRDLDVADGSSFSVGDVVWISSDVLADPFEDAQTDDLNYMAEVVAVAGDAISIDRGLPIDFSPSNATVQRYSKILRNAGVECITLESVDAADPAGFYQNINLSVRHAWNSWLWRVDLGDTFNTHAIIERSARVALLGGRLGEQEKAGLDVACDPDVPAALNPCYNKQALVFDEAHDNSFVDNVVHASIGVEFRHSASRNWVAYNWFPEPSLHPMGEPRRALFPHGNYAHSNVLEGNVFHGVGEMDFFWGSQGPRYTWFRNVALGPQSRLSVEADDTVADPVRANREANYLLNHADRYGIPGGLAIDVRSDFMHLERNLYATDLQVGAISSLGTVAIDNHDAGAGPVGTSWDGLRLPDTLNIGLDGTPAFWCTNTVSTGGEVCDFEVVSGGVGATWDGSCKLPAQVRSEGGPCLP